MVKILSVPTKAGFTALNIQYSDAFDDVGLLFSTLK
jgi:hypothetical protein